MLIWSFRKIPELNDELGFINVDDELGQTLIDNGQAQDPAIGGLFMHNMTEAEAVTPTPEEVTPPEEPAQEVKPAAKAAK